MGETRHFFFLGGGIPPKKYIEKKTLPRYDRGSPSNDNTKLDLNSEHFLILKLVAQANWFMWFMSVSNHVSSLISACAQSLHALRILRHQCINCELQQTVYRAVIVAKLLYASCAWLGCSTTAADRQRLESFLRRARRSGFYSDD